MFLDSQIAVTLAIVFSLNCAECTNTKIHFPRSNSANFPRLRLHDTLPTLREFTFCAWVRPFDSPKNYSTILSYATTRSQNELLILLFNNTNKVILQFYRGGIPRNIECKTSWDIGVWQHLCVSWFGPTGTTRAFVNGIACESVNIMDELHVIPGGGVAIIGQEQDDLDAEFDANQSWYGDMSSVQLWDEVLSELQIKGAGCCDNIAKVRKGNVISWNDTPMSVFDGAIISRAEHCYRTSDVFSALN